MLKITTQDVYLPVEEWRPVRNFEGLYEISSFGRIRSLNRSVNSWRGIKVRKGRILKVAIRVLYYSLNLRKDGKVKGKRIHILVAESFIPNPENKPQVNHLDGNKLNNRKDNLEWATPLENMHHAVHVLNSVQHGVDRHCAKFNDSIVRSMRKQYADNPFNMAQKARDFGVNINSIVKILNGKTWKHVK